MNTSTTMPLPSSTTCTSTCTPTPCGLLCSGNATHKAGAPQPTKEATSHRTCRHLHRSRRVSSGRSKQAQARQPQHHDHADLPAPRPPRQHHDSDRRGWQRGEQPGVRRLGQSAHRRGEPSEQGALHKSTELHKRMSSVSGQF